MVGEAAKAQPGITFFPEAMATGELACAKAHLVREGISPRPVANIVPGLLYDAGRHKGGLPT